MITYESTGFWQRTWFIALVVGAGVGIGAWWWQTHGAESQAGVSAAQGNASAAAAHRTRPADVALLAPPKVLDDGRPADFSREDWAALKEAMSKTANPRSELERVVKYLRFQKGVEQWQSLQDDADQALRHQLAQRLLEQVPDRLAQAELTIGEAMMLETALWTDLEPNEALRKQRIDAAQEALANAAPKPDAEQAAAEAAKLPEYKLREQAILAEYQAKPENQRDHAKLEQALEAARRDVYAGKK